MEAGYIPTSTDRTARFPYMMTLLYVPAVAGAIAGEKRKHTDAVDEWERKRKKETNMFRSRSSRTEQCLSTVWRHHPQARVGHGR